LGKEAHEGDIANHAFAHSCNYTEGDRADSGGLAEDLSTAARTHHCEPAEPLQEADPMSANHSSGDSSPDYVFGRPMETYLAPHEIARLMVYRSRILAEVCEHISPERIREDLPQCSSCQAERAD
jgi:hypothetical protein